MFIQLAALGKCLEGRLGLGRVAGQSQSPDYVFGFILIGRLMICFAPAWGQGLSANRDADGFGTGHRPWGHEAFDDGVVLAPRAAGKLHIGVGG